MRTAGICRRPNVKRAVHELGNLRAAVDWAMAATDDRTLAYELLGKCWLVWLHNGLSGEGVQRMLQLWPPRVESADHCRGGLLSGSGRLNEGAGREEHWQAARRAEVLYRQLGDADRLGDALLLVGTIGLNRNHVPEAEQALREAEELVTDATALRKQAALAATQGECYGFSASMSSRSRHFVGKASCIAAQAQNLASTWHSATSVVPSSRPAS